jgi:hypothetical protein
MAELRLEDIGIDEEGRVIITNPEVAEQVRTASTPELRPINDLCNTVAGCGGVTNDHCNIRCG